MTNHDQYHMVTAYVLANRPIKAANGDHHQRPYLLTAKVFIVDSNLQVPKEETCVAIGKLLHLPITSQATEIVWANCDQVQLSPAEVKQLSERWPQLVGHQLGQSPLNVLGLYPNKEDCPPQVGRQQIPLAVYRRQPERSDLPG